MTEQRTEDTTYGEDYFESMDGGAGYTDSTMWEDIAHTIKEAFGIDRFNNRDISGAVNVIEFGCAKGYLVKHLRRRGFDAWGVDISTYAIEHSDPEVTEYLRWFDMEATDDTHFGRGNFRLALCFETMEHIAEEHVNAALTHVRNNLAPGGRALFAICTNSRAGWDTDPTHRTMNDRAWWQRQLAIAGFMTDVQDEDDLAFLQRHWLFSDHDGIFVVSR